MKILVLTNCYPPHYLGGYEVQCKLYVEELTRRGHEVHVLTSRWKAGRGTIENNVYRLLHYNPLDMNLRLKKGPSDPFRLLRRYNEFKWAVECRINSRITRRITSTMNPDIVYVWNMGGAAISPALAAMDLGIPLVFCLGSTWLSELKTELCLAPSFLKRRYRAAIVGLTDFGRIDLRHMLVVSKWLMQKYVELGFPEQNITVIPAGIPSHVIVNTDDLPDLPRNNEGKVRLAFVGRIHPQKGVDVAIEALAHLAADTTVGDIKLDIIGPARDDYMRKLGNLVTSLGLEGRVDFMGQMEHREVLSRYAEYDALLFTSRWGEAFGLTIIEAMARGLPVIATDCAGPRDIISDGENGLLVPPDEPLLLAQAVRELIRNAPLAQKIRVAALNSVRARYTHERLVEDTEDYLQMVLQKSRGRPAQ